MAVYETDTYKYKTMKGNSPALLTVDLPMKTGYSNGDIVKLLKIFPVAVKQVDYYVKSGSSVNFSGKLRTAGGTVIVEDNFSDADKSYIGKVELTDSNELVFEFTSDGSPADAVVVFRLYYEVL